MNTPQVSIVLPCLNEEKTLARVLAEIHQAFKPSAYSYEIVVADNGSTDASASIAEANDARVVPVTQKGYGAALLGGFREARGSIIVFGDADLTYNFNDAPALVRLLMASGAQMAIGSRLSGDIERGAMPFLHRYLGTPALTHLINVLFGGQITDCNSGFRAFFKTSLAQWKVKSTGMEFASELIVNTLKRGDHIVEMPIALRHDQPGRTPHLSRWRDGMRHLLFILSRAPQGFTYFGLALLSASLLVALPCIVLGPTRFGPIVIFDLHSLILAILAGFLGSQSIFYGLLLDMHSKRPLPLNRWFLSVHEVLLLKILAALGLMILGFVAFVFTVWFLHGGYLHYLRASLSLLYATVVIGNLGLGLFISQVQRRT